MFHERFHMDGDNQKTLNRYGQLENNLSGLSPKGLWECFCDSGNCFGRVQESSSEPCTSQCACIPPNPVCYNLLLLITGTDCLHCRYKGKKKLKERNISNIKLAEPSVWWYLQNKGMTGALYWCPSIRCSPCQDNSKGAHHARNKQCVWLQLPPILTARNLPREEQLCEREWGILYIFPVFSSVNLV